MQRPPDLAGAWEALDHKGDEVKRAAVALAAASALVVAGVASAVSWQTPVGTNVVADAVFAGGGYSGPAGSDQAGPRNVPEWPLQREPVGVLDRGEARHGDADRQLEDRLREVQHLL